MPLTSGGRSGTEVVRSATHCPQTPGHILTVGEPSHQEGGEEKGTGVAPEPQQVGSNEWGAITYHPEWKTLQLTWAQTTRSMSDDGFKQTLQMLADHGLRLRPASIIIDATEFFHELGEGTLAWRDEHIVPLYNEAGVQKFAFLVTEHMPGTVEKGAEPIPDGPAAFPTGWFETRDRMYGWLTS